MLTLTSETLSYEDSFETKLQAKLDKYDNIYEQQEEELMDFMEQYHQESKQIEEKPVTLNSETLCI